MSLLLALSGGSGPVNYTLTCAAGSYSVSGVAANLLVKRNYTLACSAGSYAVSGQPATLKLGYSAQLAAGAYVVSGKAATLSYVAGVGFVAYALACAAGAYSLSGNAIELAYVPGTSTGGGSDERNRVRKKAAKLNAQILAEEAKETASVLVKAISKQAVNQVDDEDEEEVLMLLLA